MVKTVEIKGENIQIDDNYYVIYEIIKELILELRKLRGFIK